MELIFIAIIFIGFVVLVWAADKAAADEEEKDRKAIEHLPPDTQIRLWAARMREQADRL